MQITSSQSEKLLQITSQLLDFQKADKEKEQLFLTITDLVKLVSQRIQMHRASADKRNIELTFTKTQRFITRMLMKLKLKELSIILL